MARLFFLAFLLWMPNWVWAQEGFAVDLTSPAPSLDDLLVVRSPVLTTDRAEVLLGVDWAYQLLSVKLHGNQNDKIWPVESRLSSRFAGSYTLNPIIRISAGFDTILHQEGSRINSQGALVPLSASMGTAWIGSVWSLIRQKHKIFSASLETILLLPTSPPEGLAGSQRLEIQLVGLFSARFSFLRILLNLGVMSFETTQFFDLHRQEQIIYRLGSEVGSRAWPVAFSAELAGQAPLANPLASKSNQFLETFLGIRLRQVWNFELHLGVGMGLMGAGVPTLRGLFWLRWASDQT